MFIQENNTSLFLVNRFYITEYVYKYWNEEFPVLKNIPYYVPRWNTNIISIVHHISVRFLLHGSIYFF